MEQPKLQYCIPNSRDSDLTNYYNILKKKQQHKFTNKMPSQARALMLETPHN